MPSCVEDDLSKYNVMMTNLYFSSFSVKVDLLVDYFDFFNSYYEVLW